MTVGERLPAMKWAGPGLLALLVAAAVVMVLRGAAAWTLAEQGALSVWLSVELALPLAGLGLGIALVPAGDAVAAAVLFAVGLFVGFLAREWLLAVIVTANGALYRLRLLGPAACLAAGAMLVSPVRLRRWLLPVAAAVIGVAVGLAITLNDPSFHDRSYPRAAIAAACWLVVAVALTGRPFDRPWLRIGARIFASWLLAIGLLLGGATLAKQFGAYDNLSPRRPVPKAPPGAPTVKPPDYDPWHQP